MCEFAGYQSAGSGGSRSAMKARFEDAEGELNSRLEFQRLLDGVAAGGLPQYAPRRVRRVRSVSPPRHRSRQASNFGSDESMAQAIHSR